MEAVYGPVTGRADPGRKCVAAWTRSERRRPRGSPRFDLLRAASGDERSPRTEKRAMLLN